MMDLSIIIVSYNTQDFLRNCLQSIAHNVSEKLHYEIIVVDNASKDDSCEFVREEFPRVIRIQNRKNLGFSKANNIGVEHSKGRYVLFLNSDTIVHKNTLEYMVRFMDKNKNVAAATCKVVLPNGKLDDASHRGFPTPWNAFCHFLGISKVFPHSKLLNGYHLGWKDLDKVHQIDSCAGALMIVRKEAGQEVGWWDEDYFFYGEDLDFCYRLKQKGFKICFVPDVSILHYKGVSSGIKKSSKSISPADTKTKKLATKARFDAMRIFYKKHFVRKYPHFVTWMVLFAITCKEKIT